MGMELVWFKLPFWQFSLTVTCRQLVVCLVN